jgi:hypothetical protein
MLPIIDFVEFEKRPIKIDPYTMGLLLGDGDSRCRVTSMDKEIFDRIPYPLGKKDPSQYRGKAYAHTIKGIRPDYRSYGLKCKSTEKFIPKDYLFNSKEIRLELLRGMMDTDGCCSKQGEVFFSSSSLELAKDFRSLVKSLGGITNGICEEEGGDFEIKGRKCIRVKNYRVIFNLPGEKIFHLERKQKRVKDKPKTHLYVVGIEYLGRHKATCISVDAKDKLFICKNFIPTHNTASGLSMLITQAARGIKGVIKAIDSRIIVPCVKNAYYKVIQNFRNYGLIPDHKIVAQGAISLLAKEQQAQRRIEFLQMTNNPTDVGIMGPDGRRYLLKTTARSLELDENRIVPEQQMNQATPGIGQAIPSQPGPATLDQAGNPAQGTDTRMFNQGA